MATLPVNANVVPDANAQAAATAAQKRAAQIDAARQTQQNTLNLGNTKRLNSAKGKKGTQKYDYQSIQGVSDFGAGDAGPGIPWSVKHTSVSEKSKPPGTPRLPDWASPERLATGSPLWPIGNTAAPKITDWKLMAIRRRLNNG